MPDDLETKAIRRFLAERPDIDVKDWYLVTEEMRDHYRAEVAVWRGLCHQP